MSKRLIVALDFDNKVDALRTLDLLDCNKCMVKVGLQLFVSEGWELISAIKQKNFDIFLDLKLHDIPNTVSKKIEKIADFGVDMTTIHLTGGEHMIDAACQASKDVKVLGVSVLTSLSNDDILKIASISLEEKFNNLITLANNSDLDGIVCSPQELTKLKDFQKLKVVPGIRNKSSNDDQVRVLSASDAYNSGADFIVVGRPITQVSNPTEALKDFL